MKELNKLKQELLIMKTENIKPNYSELARLHECDRRTIKKYNEGYEGKPVKRNKESRLDKYKEEIKTKLELPGSTIKGTYEYFKNKDDNIGNYSNFYKYSKDFKRNKQNNKFHPRYETEFGKQLQFDWKEDIKMFNKHGEIFEFNIFSSTLGASRLHVFIYSKYKTKIDVQRCLVKTFQYIGGLPEETLTDNMSSIVDTKKKEFYKDFISFSKDIGFTPKKCKPRHAYTKGKDESCNRFMSWLIPYNGEFETEEELIKIIKKINLEVNKQINETIGTSPILLFQKEKEYLKPLPTNKILNSYLYDTITVKVSNESLFYYKGSKYSVPIKFINHTLSLREEDNKLYIYYNKDLITIHNISNQYINYKDEHYNEGIMTILKHKTQNEIEDISRKNLDLINNKKKDVVESLYELTNLEIELRNEKAIYGCVRTAGFPFLKTFDDFDFSFQPTLNKEQILDFKNLRFIENNENIIFVGSPGVGKTHLATSIGIEAAQNRNSTYFINCNDLIANLKKAQSENRFINRLNHYARYKVLIIDEVGFLPMDLDGANMLFQLINKRYEKHSTIITTNKPFGKWHEIFNDVTLANAILDRLLHHSHIININVNSYRLKDKLKIDSDVPEPMHN